MSQANPATNGTTAPQSPPKPPTQARKGLPKTNLSKSALREAYKVACGSRILEEHIVRLASRGEVKFAIWGPGEEVHGCATALALKQVVKDVSHFGIVPHYRSGCLVAMWASLHNYEDFARLIFRQQFSKDTDSMSRGRQMVNHLDIPDIGVLPVQSPVGMQLGKAAGYALGFQSKGITDGITVGIVGDGTTAEGDMHDAMTAVSVWSLPTLIMVTDNEIAISTTPSEGRGIKCFKSYAEGFGIRHYACDGRDFWDVYETTLAAAKYISEQQKPALMHVHDLPRFNGHSSAADMTFDLSQPDPLCSWGQELLAMGVLKKEEVLKRIDGSGRDFFSHHDLGILGQVLDVEIRTVMEETLAEPEPPVESVHEHIYPPFPQVQESTPAPGTTSISYAGAIRAALDHIIAKEGGLVVGQDVGKLGGVMTSTAGLKEKHGDKIIDAPLNEPLIVGTCMGAGLHKDVHALPEIQFGDYSLNAFHWLVHMGNTYWCSNGNSTTRVILRMPTDPFGGGAVYHSMSLDGYFTPIPGLVILMPSTSWDIYGLLRTASQYDGPVVVLEPKWMYRQNLGPAFPGEPTEAKAISELKKTIVRRGIPEIDADLRVPFSKAAIRRPGDDVTVVAWGRAVWTALKAADTLEAQGVSAEVIDLRTLVPPDWDTVFRSIEKTGRLVVAAEDRNFAGFVRSIQGHAVEKFPGLPSRALGQKNIPGIAQNLKMEDYAILGAADFVRGAIEVMEQELPGQKVQTAWIPPRFFVS
jgi:2-oxoisovalerate dehydrogenase E1 component